MARSTELLAVVLCTALASGCISGHAWQAARRWERVESYREARVVDGRLLVHYDATVTTDEDLPVGERSRWAEISLAELRAAPPVERFEVRWIDGPPKDGAQVAVCSAPAAESACTLARPSLCVLGERGEAGFVLTDDAGVYPPFHSGALIRSTAAPWVYPVLPFAFAVDSVMVPGLLLLAPVWIVLGD